MNYQLLNEKVKKIDFISYLLLIVFFILLFKNPNLIQDSQSYIDNAFKRPPVYPLIIDFFQRVFHKKYLFSLLIFQTFIGLISIKYFINFFKKKFLLTNIMLFFLTLIIAFPYIGVSMSLGNSIMSESIGYPLFLIFLILLFKKYILQKKKIKHEIKFYTILLTLILTKKTFMFLIPIIFVLDLYLVLKIKNFKKIFLNILSIILLVYISGFLEKINNYYKHNTFSTISVLGSSFVTAPFYLASNEDLKKIKGKKNIEIINFVKKKFEDDNIKRARYSNTFSQNKNFIDYAKFQRDLFSDYFNKYVYMQWVFEHPIKNVFSELNNKQYKKVSNDHCIQIAKQLFMLNPLENFVFYLTNVTYGFGGYFLVRNDLKGFYANVGFNGFNLLIINFLFFIFIFLKNFYEKFNDIFYLIIFVLIIVHISNVFAVSFFQPVYDRFSFFSNTVLIFSFFLVMNRSIFNKNERQ